MVDQRTGASDGDGATEDAERPRRGSREPETSASLRVFGSVVQALRTFVGLERAELAPLLSLSPHTLASIEQGRRTPPPEFLDHADDYLGGTGAVREAGQHITRDQPGLAAWFRRWASMERTAIALYTYECRLIPGLLQPESYMRKLFEDRVPSLSDEEIETQWVARLDRQRLLLRERPHTMFTFIMEEHLFHRRLGGPEVTRELIDNTLALAALRNVEVQLMPLECGSHAGVDGPLQLLETPDHKWHAYCEGQEGGILISDRKVVSTLQKRYARMRGQALDVRESVGVLQRMRGAL
ncbi:helix-turn-helix domain-containing protein [Streptomyces sp. LP05-1]|uniref:Helix-turn-helix domain-containing protein n=1 Tax=Streptomyces pyxinae TaxID=2970734 RepID=A0ABT2CPY7_9ACTN|nr:helix-turn-helix transcriptional regulator [Streptomyces sp. LP05-1]MCS0639502.1 helix-turn-helix domain-containing protein [Streptomyces sp. LP05-1]